MKTRFRLRYDSHMGEELFLSGNTEALGLWNTDKAVAMKYVGPGIWSVETEVSPTTEYKYFIRENGQIRWEEGYNRTLLEDKNRTWDWFGYTRRQTMKGVAVPLFSLRTKGGFGIGEFTDLPLLGDWCVANGLKIIQILPINDTTAHYDWSDSYPYNAVSVFALNPIYLNIRKLGIHAFQPIDPKKLRRADEITLLTNKLFGEKQQTLNEKDFVDYPEVLKAKWKYFDTAFNEQWETIKDSEDFQRFFKENEDWLPDYAQYCAERDGNGTEIHLFLQYHCDKQLREAVKVLHGKGLLLKGDIPIGVNPNGVDVKSHPELFNLDVQVGAPPDDFSAEGQNWGFPSYNWEAMAKDGYAWWRRRLQVMARYFDAFRIDHILGFFRIWEIPKTSKSSMLGHFSPALPLSAEEMEHRGFHFIKGEHVRESLDTLFVPDPNEPDKYHPRIELQNTEAYQSLYYDQKQALNDIYEDFYFYRHNDFWKLKALEKLPALVHATPMIACGEDLGMIPASVPEVMQQLSIMSLEVQRMPKETDHPFVQTEDLPENSVYTTGTHDMPTLRGWLEEDLFRTFRFLDSLGIDDREVTAKTIKKVIDKHMDSPAKWIIYPLQDLLDRDEKNWSPNAKDDQINVPSNPNNQWKWRMRMNLETLLPTIQ